MLDAKYPGIVRDAAELMAASSPRTTSRQHVHEGRMVALHAYHGHWTCLFPQHGPEVRRDLPPRERRADARARREKGLTRVRAR
jgi:hypothetical protein